MLIAVCIAASCLLGWNIQSARQRQNDDLLRLLLDQQVDQQAAEVAKRKAAREADREFAEKFNAHSDAMNAIAADRIKGVANLKRFEAAAKSWDKLYNDPGWLKKK